MPDYQVIIDYYPAVFLGIILYMSGYYLVYPDNKKHLLKLIVMILFASLGWRLSINYGFMWGGPVPYVNAGAVGAFMVALGWLIAWQIRLDALKLLVIITIAGAVGGLVFQVIDTMTDMNEILWIFVLFTEWQGILFLGIALAHLLTNRKEQGLDRNMG